MENHVGFFNWSLNRLLASESNTFNKAKLKILYAVITLSIIKTTVAVFFAWENNQELQINRAIIYLVFYTIILKLLLYRKEYINIITHSLLILGLTLILSNIFFIAKPLNIITIQFVFMLILSSFYLLGTGFGIFYSLIVTIPIMIGFFISNNLFLFGFQGDSLASPGFEIITALNFLTIILSHYLFHNALTQNVKEKEVLNSKLTIAIEEAKEAVSAKSDFLSIMSHELRTPLNSVIGMTDLFINDPSGIERKENLDVLRFSALNLQSLINDILDFNKLEAYQIKLETIDIHLFNLVNHICSGLNFKAKEKGIELILDADKRLEGLYVLTDSTRITQILNNLIGNSLKFTSQGSVKVVLEIINEDSETVTVKFAVIDTGIGIGKENQQLIFEPFKQASTSTTRSFGGTGLGLSIVKQLLSLLNSDIKLQSSLNEGSNFNFEITFKKGKNPNLTNILEPIKLNDISNLKILVVDDNLMNRLLVKKVLAKWNIASDFAENGQEAIEKADTNIYDVILMDIHMPILDGYEASKAIRCTYPNHNTLKIIAFTASVSGNLSEKINDCGMDDFIYKPFNTNDLYDKLKVISSNKITN